MSHGGVRGFGFARDVRMVKTSGRGRLRTRDPPEKLVPVIEATFIGHDIKYTGHGAYLWELGPSFPLDDLPTVPAGRIL